MTDAFFNSLDEVLDEEARKEDRINASLLETQKYIDHGTKVILLTPAVAHQPIVVGRILPPEDFEDAIRLSGVGSYSEWPSVSMGTMAEELARHEQGWRRGLYFGKDFKTGYLGSYHLSRLFPITETEFESIREADCDPKLVGKQDWYRRLMSHIATAVETREGSPYRKLCEKCASDNVGVVTYYSGRKWQPCTLQVTAVGLQVRTGHETDDEVLETGERHFRCLDCTWESAPLSQEDYPEVHACTHKASQLEALFLLGGPDDVL